MMKIYILLGGIRVLIDSTRQIEVGDRLCEFVLPADTPPDVVFGLSWDYENARLPAEHTPCIGEDLILRHYREDDRYFCIVKGHPSRGNVAVTEYSPDFSYVHCTINEEPFTQRPKDLETILRFYPLMAMFQYFGVLFFHASQIEHEGKGILFTAPSGTGKSTQARLWNEYRNARILCNDRTLVRRTERGWETYGYPADGSSPISTGTVTKLGAIMLISQAPQNKLEKVPLFKLTARLMPQLVFDTWDPEARVKAMNGLLELLAEIPVYHFGCTPDQEAVDYLERQLRSDGVFENG